jgi:hypothetical protein
MNYSLLIDLAIAAVAGWYIVYGGKGKGQGGRVKADSKDIGRDGVVTSTINYELRAAGQGLPGYYGVNQFKPEMVSTDKEKAVTQVKQKVLDYYEQTGDRFVDPVSIDPYLSISQGTSQVVPFVKTYGAALKGSNIPGSYTVA